jgi:O-antigen/teichoic acid export membrane protein
VYVASALAGVLLALMLVPRWGLSGAVWAMYGSEVAALVIQMIMSKRNPEKKDERSE